MNADNTPRYVRSGKGENKFHLTVVWLTRHGISIYGSRALYVRGRKSGEWRVNPVNPLTLDGGRYLVAPRGHTQWVRNLRVTGEGELRVGRRVEPFTATEMADADKPAVLRGYLKKWGWEVGRFFENVDAKSSDERLLEIAPDFPVFVITDQR
ncbi:MAG TPA: nitroreductase/quinone reductase family protein [Pseudonocardiaceae bacterium]|jgi:deazaflavin-dependent oxidoreductase (nitroreductase family)|nr:nitroreductase/quinone reductase family protein [Pseudonocardiaceae bacterium]